MLYVREPASVVAMQLRWGNAELTVHKNLTILAQCQMHHQVFRVCDLVIFSADNYRDKNRI